MIASSASLRTVDLRTFGPIGASLVEVLRFHLMTEIAPEPTGHGLPLNKCEAYNRGRCKSLGDQVVMHDRDAA